MAEIFYTIESEQPLLIANIPDPFHNVWTPDALRGMAAQKPDELRYDEQSQTLYMKAGARIKYADDRLTGTLQ